MCSSSGNGILLVDDRLEGLDWLIILLRRVGYKVDTARTAGEVISRIDEMCRAGSPCYDLLIIDIDLPDVRGTTLGAWVHDRHPYVSIMFLTAWGKLAGFIDVADRIGAPIEDKPIANIEAFLELTAKLIKRAQSIPPEIRSRGAIPVPGIMVDHIAEIARGREAAK